MCEGVSSEVTDLEEIINNDYFIICVECYVSLRS